MAVNGFDQHGFSRLRISGNSIQAAVALPESPITQAALTEPTCPRIMNEKNQKRSKREIRPRPEVCLCALLLLSRLDLALNDNVVSGQQKDLKAARVTRCLADTNRASLSLVPKQRSDP
jgi:hypothetical protein